MMRSEIDVLTPRTVDEALELLRQEQAGMKIVAGGSDVIVQLRDGVMKAEKLLNILPLRELRFVRKKGGEIHIGSLATYSDIVNSKLAREHAWILVHAAKQIGAVQLQNTATIGGNLGNASPAGDSLPPLYALDTIVVTRSKAGRRETPIEQFYVSYRKTALRPDELIEEIHFKALNSKDRGAYMKLGLREANAISIVDVAVALRERNSDESFGEARVALGAVAPVITRARKSENALTHTPLNETILRKAATLASEDAAPITDIRGSADYRKDAVASSVYQALYEAVYGGEKATAKPVRVRVKIFGAPLLALESKELTLELREDATTEDLLNSIPVKDKDYLYIVREGVRLNATSKLNDGDEILIVPPIAGG